MTKTGFYQRLEKKLKEDKRFVDEEGNLIKGEVINKAYQIDDKLIELLSSVKEFKDFFFKKIKDLWVFDINKFVDSVEKNLLGSSYTQFSQKIGLTISNKFMKKREEVALVWPYKDCVLEGGMTKEDEGRNEIFFNEVLDKDEIDRLEDPKVLTNFKKFTAKGEEKVKDFKRDEKRTIKDNLIIKGNNLLALHSLKEQFREQVKLIYIDPPYNTGGAAETFTYNNDFNHSTWLTFMKNRLETANEFLRDDGFIAITIDHNELFYVGALADEIFGRENRAGIVTIIINPKGRQNPKYFSAIGEYMLIYAKDVKKGRFNKVVLDEDVLETFKEEDKQGKFRWENFINARTRTLRENRPNHWYPIYVSKDLKNITLEPKKNYHKVLPISAGKEYSWKLIKESFKKKLEEEPDYFTAEEEKGKVNILHKFREQQRINNVWIDKKYFAEFQGTLLLKKLLGENIFSYPKSLYSVKDTIKLIAEDDDIIMDFFAGSGTTGHATLELNKEDGGNRQFILIEQLDTHMDVILRRMQKVMQLNTKEKTLNNFDKNESFIYCELLRHNQEAIDKIQDAKDTKQLLKIWDEMCEKYFLNYDVDIKKFNDNKKNFEKMSLPEQKKMLVSMLDKNQLYVNLTEIEDSQFKVSKEDKDLNKKFYGGK